MALLDRTHRVGGRDGRRSLHVELPAIFVLALAVRLGLVVASPGGFSGTYGYDPGVYFDAALQLVHGRLPYDDFVLLHPPGLTLLLSPCAALARLTSDHAAFVTANVVCCALGAANAVLVAAIARRIGLSRPATLLGGVFYAVWMSAAGAETSARLEPLGTFCFLSGVLFLLDRDASTRRLLLGGFVLGLAVTVKIWWIVPVLVVLTWRAAEPVTSWRRRAAPLAAVGALAAAVLVAGPFLANAPTSMWRMIVLDQLGRHRVHSSVALRLSEVASVVTSDTVLRSALAVGCAVLGVVLIVRMWRRRRARMFAVLAVAQLTVILASPTYFSYYSGYPAAVIAVALAVACDSRAAGERRFTAWFAAGVVAVVAAACVLVTTLLATHPTEIRPFPAAQLTSALRSYRCVTADSPMALIEMNVLSRNLSRGCPDWGDVSGRTYDTDAPRAGADAARSRNPRWQADIRRYLLSGDAFVMIRPATGLNSATLRELQARPVIARAGGFTVYRGLGRSR